MLIEAFAIWPNEGQAILAIAGSNLTGVDISGVLRGGEELGKRMRQDSESVVVESPSVGYASPFIGVC